MKRLLKNNRLILMEAAIVEPLRRLQSIELHDALVHAPLIYDPKGRALLEGLYQSYIDVASQANLPMLIGTPTWRASQSRVAASHIDTNINVDAVHFLQTIRKSKINKDVMIKIGGVVGCKHDGYRPDQGLSALEAEQYHSWQVDQLADGGADFLIAETLPNVKEALGIAKAMAAVGAPYLISFVISRDGCVLDGTTLMDAITYIDTHTFTPPLGYMVNCAYPSFLCPNLQPAQLYERLIGYQANASSLNHSELDNSRDLRTNNIAEWGDLMVDLHLRNGLQILGGCCGTNRQHLEYIADRVAPNIPSVIDE